MNNNTAKKRKIGLKIKLARKELGLTQEELGQKIGKKANYIYKVESGRHSYKYDFLLKISAVLKKTPVYFLDIENIYNDIETKEPKIIADEQTSYNYLSQNLKQIIEMLKEYPEVQKKCKDYLLSYHNGGKDNLSRIGGFIDALSSDQAEKIIPILVKKIKNC